MLPERILLIDHGPRLVAAWSEAFGDIEGVDAIEADYFSEAADAMVSPANSFGIMDGGLDLAIRDTLGFDVQTAVQRAIVQRYHGEMPVGAAEIVETGHAQWPYLVAAPTMRVPESVAHTTNAYAAFRAILLAVRRFNAAGDAPRIRSLVCPGLGTGIGGLEPRRCAAHMRMAYRQVAGPARIPSFNAIHASHRALRQS